MPNRNGTGPEGKGPMTGRGMGPCGQGGRISRGKGVGRRYEGESLIDTVQALEKRIADLEKRSD